MIWGGRGGVSAGVTMGSTCQPGEKEERGTGSGGKGIGPWASFGLGPKRFSTTFFSFFLIPFLFMFSIETFANKSQIGSNHFQKCEKISLVNIDILGSGFDPNKQQANLIFFNAML
jgi:hypothetical protein